MTYLDHGRTSIHCDGEIPNLHCKMSGCDSKDPVFLSGVPIYISDKSDLVTEKGDNTERMVNGSWRDIAENCEKCVSRLDIKTFLC